MDLVKKFLYVVDHKGFLDLTAETWKNRWFPSQICLTTDVVDVAGLNPVDREFYQYLFTFLGLAEKLVNFNIEELLKEFDSHDVKHYYDEQMAMENIHAKVYANILHLFFQGNRQAMVAYAEAVVTDNDLKVKLEWLHGKVATAKTIAEKVLIFLLIEGIFFVSSFYSIGLLRMRGLMRGVCMANDYISRDELLHTRAAAVLYNTLVPGEQKPAHSWITALFKEAVEIEFNFINAKGKDVTLVKPQEIKQFLECTADRILLSIGISPVYNTQPPPGCPLVYNGCIKNVNFFERETTDYTTCLVNDL